MNSISSRGIGSTLHSKTDYVEDVGTDTGIDLISVLVIWEPNRAGSDKDLTEIEPGTDKPGQGEFRVWSWTDRMPLLVASQREEEERTSPARGEEEERKLLAREEFDCH